MPGSFYQISDVSRDDQVRRPTIKERCAFQSESLRKSFQPMNQTSCWDLVTAAAVVWDLVVNGDVLIGHRQLSRWCNLVSLGRNNSPGPAISQSELTEPMRTVFVSAPIDKLSVLLDNDEYVDDDLGDVGDDNDDEKSWRSLTRLWGEASSPNRGLALQCWISIC